MVPPPPFLHARSLAMHGNQLKGQHRGMPPPPRSAATAADFLICPPGRSATAAATFGGSRDRTMVAAEGSRMGAMETTTATGMVTTTAVATAMAMAMVTLAMMTTTATAAAAAVITTMVAGTDNIN